MKIDTLILKRFEELEERAQAIDKGKQYYFTSNDGSNVYYKYDSAGFHQWGTSVLSLLDAIFGRESIYYKNFQDHYTAFQGWGTPFDHAVAVFRAAREDYARGYLFTVRGLVKAEVLDDSLEQADELLKAGYKDPACILLAGVALEVALKELCSRHTISLGKMDRMNVDLQKAGVYNMAKQKQITAWAEMRNKAAHGEWPAYNDPDVADLIQGVSRFVADHL
jgi:hypothetical protein